MISLVLTSKRPEYTAIFCCASVTSLVLYKEKSGVSITFHCTSVTSLVHYKYILFGVPCHIWKSEQKPVLIKSDSK